MNILAQESQSCTNNSLTTCYSCWYCNSPTLSKENMTSKLLYIIFNDLTPSKDNTNYPKFCI